MNEQNAQGFSSTGVPTNGMAIFATPTATSPLGTRALRLTTTNGRQVTLFDGDFLRYDLGG